MSEAGNIEHRSPGGPQSNAEHRMEGEAGSVLRTALDGANRQVYPTSDGGPRSATVPTMIDEGLYRDLMGLGFPNLLQTVSQIKKFAIAKSRPGPAN